LIGGFPALLVHEVFAAIRNPGVDERMRFFVFFAAAPEVAGGEGEPQ